jgi:mediator of RNA polymerase II transcription subunit 16
MDDLLALARPFALKHERFATDWAMELAQILKVQVDWSAEDANKDTLIRNETLHTCFTILHHLGLRGEFQPKSFGSKFAMLAMNVRACDVLVTCAMNSPARLGRALSPLDEPEVVEVLASCAKWFFDLLAYLTDCLFDLRGDPEFTAILKDPRKFAELTAHLQSKKNVALHLMLCSSTRNFLAIACRQFMHFAATSHRAVDFQNRLAMDPAGGGNPLPVPLFEAYQKMHQQSSNALVKLADFEKLLKLLNQEIRLGYETSLPGLSVQGKQANNQQGQAGAQRGKAPDDPVKRALDHCELSLLLAMPPPPSFQKVLVNFFKYVNVLWAQTKPLKLFLADYSLLEVDEDERILARRKARRLYVDVFKRCELNASDRTSTAGETPREGLTPEVLDKQWRRCVRCAAVMQNVSAGQKPGFTFVLGQQRKCACGGHWGMLHPGEMVS